VRLLWNLRERQLALSSTALRRGAASGLAPLLDYARENDVISRIRIGAVTASRSQPLTPPTASLAAALLMARAAGQIDRAPVAGQINGVLIHEGPGRRITVVA
jgi:hypothetical protein